MADPIQVEQNLEFGEVPNIPAKNRSFYMAFFQMRRPVTSGELNHIQQVQRDALGRTAATFAQQGWAFLSDFTTNWQAIDQAGQDAAQTTNLVMTLGRDSALVSDMAVEVSSRTGNGDLTIDLGTAPVTGIRKDFIFVEIANVSVGGFGTDASDQDVFTYGRWDGGTEYNDILQNSIVDVETARRIQTRWRLRVVPDVSFFANPQGFASPIVTAQGSNISPIPNYTFVDLGVTPTEDGPARRELSGLWRAGSGSRADANALGTFDGYVYALPMFIVTRTASVSEPDIDDIRQLTNGNLIGVFEFLAPCTLIIKALPILYYDCSKTFQQARLTHGTSPLHPESLVADQMQGLFAARQLQSTAPGPSGQPIIVNGISVPDPGTPPLIVNSTTLVPNLNVSYLQGSEPGSGPGNVLQLDNDANAVVGGISLSLSAGSGINGAFQTVSLINSKGDAWFAENALYDNELDIWYQNNINYPSSALEIDRQTGKVSFNYTDSLPAQTGIQWIPSFVIDKRNARSILYSDLVVPSGKIGVGLGMSGANPIYPSHAMDIVGTTTITSNTTTPALIVTPSPSSDGIQVSGQGVGTKAVNASSTAGDAIYGISSTGSAGHLVSSSTGFALYAQGAKSVFMPVDGGTSVNVGINVISPTYELEVAGRVKTSSFQLANGDGNAPVTGYYLSAINGTGLAGWQPLPTGPIPAASGTNGYYARWTPESDADNTLGSGNMYEFHPNIVTVSYTGNSDTVGNANLNVAGAIVVGGQQQTAITNTVATTVSRAHPLFQYGALVFGEPSSAGGISTGTEAIFSNKVANTGSGGAGDLSNAGGLSFMTQSLVRMVISSNGKVGIGINNIDTGIHGIFEAAGAAGIGSGIGGNARVDYDYFTIATGNSNGRTGIQFKRQGVSTFEMGTSVGIGTGTPGGEGNFYIKDNTVANVANNQTRFIIDATGNIGVGNGIGNISLTRAFQVVGDIANEGSVYVTGTGSSPNIVINRNSGADKNTSIGFRALNIPIFTMQTFDNAGSAAFSISDATRTRIYMDTTSANMTINSATNGSGVLNVAADDGSVLAGSAASPFFTVNSGTMRSTVGSTTLASFGTQTNDTSGLKNVSLGVHSYRLAAGTLLSTVAVGVGYDMETSTNYNNSGLWFYSNGGISIGATPTVTIQNSNLALHVTGNVQFNGAASATGAITTISNILGVGAGYNPAINDATYAYLRISAARGTNNNVRSGIVLTDNTQTKWIIGNDMGLNGGQNFFIQDATNSAFRLFIDSVGHVGIGQQPSATLGASLDVAGAVGIRTSNIGIGPNAFPSDANNGGSAGVMSVIGPARFKGVAPTAVDVTLGIGSYGLAVTTNALAGNNPNNITPFLVTATNNSSGTYAAVIQNVSLGGGLYLSAVSGNNALVVASGNSLLYGPTIVQSTLTATGNITSTTGGLYSQGSIDNGWPPEYGLAVVNNAYIGKAVGIVGALSVYGQAGFGNTVAIAGSVYIYNSSNLYVSGSVGVTGSVNTNNLHATGWAVLNNSIQKVDGGGRLHAILGEYAGHSIKDYIYINPSDPHNVLLRPRRFTGLEIGGNWYEILGDTVPVNTLAGSPDGAWELCAYGLAPEVLSTEVSSIETISIQKVGLIWRPGPSQAYPNGYTKYINDTLGYWDVNGESHFRVIANYWHSQNPTSDLPNGGIVPFSKDTTDLDFVNSSSVGLRVREFYSNANNNGSIWTGGTQHFWVDEVAGTGFPIYTFYLPKAGFVQFNWTTYVGNTQVGSSSLALIWKVHLSSNGADWVNTHTEIDQLTQYTILQVGGIYPQNSTWIKYLPAGIHRLRQHVDATDQFGGAHSFNLNLASSELQLVFWSSEPNGYVTSYAPVPPPPPPASTPPPPSTLITPPGLPRNFTAAGVWTRSEECHWSVPLDTGNGYVTYDVEFNDYGANNSVNPPTHGYVEAIDNTGFQRDVVEDDHTQYRIRSRNSAGLSAWSGWVDAYTWHTNVPDVVVNNINRDTT